MPLIYSYDYRPNFIFRNGHVNTIFPYLFRKVKTIFTSRERYNTSDDDFIDLDCIFSNNSRLVILCHGLEGSSDSQYIQHVASTLSSDKWDVIAINFRSCSGEMNKQLHMYHSGHTSDLHGVIQFYQNNYQSISIIGFSLGGNVVLKYVNDDIFDISSKIKSIVGVSVPCDLEGSAEIISHWTNKIYDSGFLKTLKRKLRQKHNLFPDEIDLGVLSKVSCLYEFDNLFTAPLHGFIDAKDYYTRCNCLQFLQNVKIPTLLINALDDPFLSTKCYPFDLAKRLKYLYFLAP
ncbi:MAG: alpha/beta fold hydrolase, partial [Saprospiraceae bacterium]